MRILVIRRDNIGDLVCTTPLLHALREQLPAARIEVLTTRYTAAVLQGNPDVDALHIYTKGKHRQPGESWLGWLVQRLTLIWRLRRQPYDWVLLPGAAQGSAVRQANLTRALRVLAREDGADAGERHEVELCCRMLDAMGLREDTPPVRVLPDPAERAKALHAVEAWRGEAGEGSAQGAAPLVALHISARKPSQRWSAENFAALARELHARHGARCLLLWSPGAQDDPLHPGDDEKAAAVMAAAGDAPLLPMPTHRLEELIGVLSVCDAMICGDGGAMHLAAGLGKPIIALFGQSDVTRWRPWGVPQVLLQKPSRDVADVSVAEVLAAWDDLQRQCASSQLAPTPTSASSGTES